MIGNAREAEFIRDWYMEYQAKSWAEQGLIGDAPEGWEWLGQGCYRTAFLAPSGVVYKVQGHYPKRGTYHCGQTNAAEAASFRKFMFRKLPRGCRFPRFQLFELDGRTVIAMEKFDKLLKDFNSWDNGEGSKYWKLHQEVQEVLHEVYDAHGGNFAIDVENGQLVPIDVGGTRNSYQD